MRLTQHCYAVTGLGYGPPWCVNAGIIAGDAIALVVDTGGNSLAAQTIHGYAAAVATEKPIRVVNTERHFDHIGGNSYFHRIGVEIWGHAGITRTPAEFALEVQEFNDAIPDAARRAACEAQAFFWDTELCNPTHAVTEDLTLDLGGLHAELLLTPGHTATNLSVWVSGEGVLYTGDCLIREYLPNLDAGGPEDWRLWLESLDRIEALQPEIMVAGHGPVARGAEVQASIESVRAVLRESIIVGYSPTRSKMLL